jgi:hypothetical protein
MKYLLRFSFGNEAGNEALKDPQFGAKVKQYLTDVKAEHAFFGAIDGQRGGYIVINIDDASQIPSIAEPLFLWLEADMEFIPVMTPADLEKAGPSIGAAVKKWA